MYPWAYSVSMDLSLAFSNSLSKFWSRADKVRLLTVCYMLHARMSEPNFDILRCCSCSFLLTHFLTLFPTFSYFYRAMMQRRGSSLLAGAGRQLVDSLSGLRLRLVTNNRTC